jgi:hypothetical protein
VSLCPSAGHDTTGPWKAAWRLESWPAVTEVDFVTRGKSNRRGKPTTAKKTTAAKKQPTRPALKAKFNTTCEVCGETVKFGSSIARVGEKYGHPACAEYARNKRRIEAGETYRGRKVSDWSRGTSPSSSKTRR